MPRSNKPSSFSGLYYPDPSSALSRVYISFQECTELHTKAAMRFKHRTVAPLTHTYIQTHTYTHTYTYTYTYTYTHTHTQKSRQRARCVFVFFSLSIYLSIYSRLSIYLYLYMQAYSKHVQERQTLRLAPGTCWCASATIMGRIFF